MANFDLIIYCTIYALLNVSGATIIKSELPQYDLSNIFVFVQLFKNMKVLLGAVFIISAAPFIIKALGSYNFSTVIPVATGLNFALTILIGILFFKDSLSFPIILSIILIFSGIIAMSFAK